MNTNPNSNPNPNTNVNVDALTHSTLDTPTDTWRDRILHTLSIYPRISPSMLQIAMGGGVSPKVWKPVLNDLINKGVVRMEVVNRNSPIDQLRSYKVISLVDPSN